MDMNDLGKSFGIGLLVGLLFMFFSTVALLPASYFMNRFVYHSGAMRLLLMVFSIALAPIFFAVLIVGRIFGFIHPTHYFGLFPIILYETPKGDVSGWYAWLQKLWIFLLHPLIMFYEGDADKQGFIAAVEMLTGKEDEKKVDEKLYAAARDAGAERYLSKWHDGIKKIQELFKIIPGKDVSMETCKDDEKLAEILSNTAPEKPSEAGNNAKMKLFAEKLGAVGLLNKPQQPEKELNEEEFKAEVERGNKLRRYNFYPKDPETKWQEEKKRREAKAAAAPVTNPASSQTPTNLSPGPTQTNLAPDPKSPSLQSQTSPSTLQTNPSELPVV